MRGMFRRKKKGVDVKKRFGSIAFFLAIPVTYALAAVAATTIVLIVSTTQFSKTTWALFGHAFLSALLIGAVASLPRLRTFVHEMKHAVLILLLGNKVTEISVGSGSGHVSYETGKETLHLEPFVVLAPYYFPLFSLPVLTLSILFEGFYRPMFVYALGIALALDLATAYREVHPYQSDLRRIFGGYFTTRLFLFGANALWSMLCVIWVAGGREGYVRAFWLLMQTAESFARRVV